MSCRSTARPTVTIPPPETSATGRPAATWSSTTTTAAPYFDGIVHIGQFDGDMEALEHQSDDFDISIELTD